MQLLKLSQNLRRLNLQGTKHMATKDTCVVCGSANTIVLKVHSRLSYNCCQSCWHCELINPDGNMVTSFESAQEKYFGDTSLLVHTKPNPFDEEILSVRKNLVGPVLSVSSDVLEVGPGSGAFSIWLSDHGHRVICVEQSKVLAKKLAERIPTSIVSDEFENSDIDKESIDVFCSFHVIEHVRDPLVHLQKALGVVKTGGLAFIATPNAGSWEQRFFPLLSPNFDSAHLRVFSQASLYRLCEEAGWSVEHVITPEHSIYWMRVVTKLLRRAKGEDEEETAGKYAGQNSVVINTIGRVVRIITYPLRSVQKNLGGGNELFLILKKNE